MKDIRYYFAKIISLYNRIRESRAQKRLVRYFELHPHLSDEQHKAVMENYHLHLAHKVESEIHADIRYLSIEAATHKELLSGSRDLYSWWYYIIYYREVIRYRLFHWIFPKRIE